MTINLLKRATECSTGSIYIQAQISSGENVYIAKCQNREPSMSGPEIWDVSQFTGPFTLSDVTMTGQIINFVE